MGGPMSSTALSAPSPTASVHGGPPALAVSLLGPLEARWADEPLRITARNERAVLIVLALRAGHSVATHELAGAVWGDDPPANWPKGIQVYVSRLRKGLGQVSGGRGQDLVVTTGGGYQLVVDPEVVDSFRFERLVASGRRALADGRPADAQVSLGEALSLWRGEALADLADTALGIGERSRLGELRWAAVEEAFEADLALGGHHLVIPRLEASLAEAPLRERLWRQLLLALYRADRQADALRAYQRARTVLVEELGLEPGSELRRLEARIVAQDPSLDLLPTAGRRPAAEQTRVPAGLLRWARALQPLPFCDRVEEREVLRRAHALALEAGPVLVGVEGDEGIGKTRLVGEAALEWADGGSVVLAGRCERADGARYGPIRQILDLWVRSGRADVDRWPESARARLAAISLAVADSRSEGVEPTRIGPDANDPYSVAFALASALGAVADVAPVVLVIDDLHRADVGTVDVIRHLVGDGHLERLLVVTLHRSDELADDSPAADLLAERLGHRGTERIELTGLPVEASVALLGECLGHPVDDESRLTMATLGRDAGGNPLLLVEVARHAVEQAALDDAEAWRWLSVARLGAPASVVALARRRLRALSPEGREVLSVASVIGPVFDVSVVARVAGVPEQAVIDALDGAAAAGLVLPDDAWSTAAFANVVLRAGIYQSLPSATRIRLHRQAGGVLAAVDAPVADRLSGATEHLAHAESGGTARPREDLAGPAWERYVDAYRQAEALVAGADALAERGDPEPSGRPAADSTSGDPLAGVAAVPRDRDGDVERRCRMLIGMASTRWRSGDLAGAREMFEAAAVDARLGGHDDLFAWAAAGAAKVVMEVGVTHPPIIEMLGEARSRLPADHPLQAEVRSALIPELIFAGRWRDAAAMFRQSSP